MTLKICKFGGSSLADASQFKKVKKIIETDPSRKIIVVSASGKRFKDDNKITDLLYLCHAHIKYGVSFDSIYSIICERFENIVNELNLKLNISNELNELRKKMNYGIDEAYLVSRGEYLTARCMSDYLSYQFIDAKEVICFKYNGQLDLTAIKEKIEKLLKLHQRIVIPGFYGSLPNGEIRLMSRGGSDITGSILANVCNADLYENWTDVSGILVADPKIVENPKEIKRITYTELRELSYMGANVLHEEAVFPVKDKNIPIQILNTNDPTSEGTLIMNDCSELDKLDPPYFITGISGKKDYSSITIYKSNLSNEIGTFRKALQVCEDYHLSVESIPVGIDSFSIVISSAQANAYLYEMMNEIKETIHADSIDVVKNLSMIAIVGRGMKFKPGMSGRLFAELGKHDINIRLINQGSDEITIIIGVENEDFEKTIQVIYEKFIRGEKCEKI